MFRVRCTCGLCDSEWWPFDTAPRIGARLGWYGNHFVTEVQRIEEKAVTKFEAGDHVTINGRGGYVVQYPTSKGVCVQRVLEDGTRVDAYLMHGMCEIEYDDDPSKDRTGTVRKFTTDCGTTWYAVKTSSNRWEDCEDGEVYCDAEMIGDTVLGHVSDLDNK